MYKITVTVLYLILKTKNIQIQLITLLTYWSLLPETFSHEERTLVLVMVKLEELYSNKKHDKLCSCVYDTELPGSILIYSDNTLMMIYLCFHLQVPQEIDMKEIDNFIKVNMM